MTWFFGGNAAALYLHVMSFYGATALGAPAWMAVSIPCIALIALAVVVAWREEGKPKDILVATLTVLAIGVSVPGVVLSALADTDVKIDNAPEWTVWIGFSAFGPALFYLWTFLEVPWVLVVISVTGAYALQIGIPIVMELVMRPQRHIRSA